MALGNNNPNISVSDLFSVIAKDRIGEIIPKFTGATNLTINSHTYQGQQLPSGAYLLLIGGNISTPQILYQEDFPTLALQCGIGVGASANLYNIPDSVTLVASNNLGSNIINGGAVIEHEHSVVFTHNHTGSDSGHPHDFTQLGSIASTYQEMGFDVMNPQTGSGVAAFNYSGGTGANDVGILIANGYASVVFYNISLTLQTQTIVSGATSLTENLPAGVSCYFYVFAGFVDQ